MPANKNPDFELSGINHLALVCKDMARTVEFYRDVLGMPLIKTLDLPGDMGQHFFFDVGNGDSIAFFWFPKAPAGLPGVSSPVGLIGESEDIFTGHGSMNHVAINVPAEKFDEYHQKLKEKGVEVSRIVNHDDSPTQMSDHLHDGVFVRSFYFFDPDGISLEFATWTKVFDDSDVVHEPRRADGTRAEGVLHGA